MDLTAAALGDLRLMAALCGPSCAAKLPSDVASRTRGPVIMLTVTCARIYVHVYIHTYACIYTHL